MLRAKRHLACGKAVQSFLPATRNRFPTMASLSKKNLEASGEVQRIENREGRMEWVMQLKPISAVAMLVAFFTAAGCAQDRVIPGRQDSDGLPTSPARLCVGAAPVESCYEPPSDEFKFGIAPQARTIASLDGYLLVLFTATFSGGGSGLLTNFALLKIQDGALTDLPPRVQLTDQSEYKIWNLPEVSQLPVLVTADFVWDMNAGETHFAPHRYRISAYVFDPLTGKYSERVQYRTKKKYPGEDDVAAIFVIGAEQPVILSALRHPKPIRN